MDKQQYMQQISEHFGSGSPISMGWIVIAAGLVMALIGGLALRHWWTSRHQRPTPVLSFVAVARELGLAKADQWLLLRIAMRQQLPSPITLLASPATLEHHARAVAARLSPGRSAKLKRRVEAIGARLFGAERED